MSSINLPNPERVVWLASWPRCGNTLLRMILSQAFGLKSLTTYEKESETFGTLAELIGHEPDTAAMQQVADTQAIIPVKTHEPPKDGHKAIYIVRDGREACVSCLHFAKNIIEAPDCTLRDVIEGKYWFGSWTDHLAAWMPKQRPNTLLVSYEILLSHIHESIGAIGAFLGLEPTRVELPDFEWLHEQNPYFFRCGTNISWKEEMVGDDLERFWELHGAAMNDFGYLREFDNATCTHNRV